MKLHLPTGLRAALIAAIATIGFTLTQAQAGTTETTLTTTFANCAQATATSVTAANAFADSHVVTIPGASVTSLTQHTSSSTVNLKTSGAAGGDATFFSPDNNVGNAQAWTLTMSYTDTADIQSITGMTLSVGLFSGGGDWQSGSASWTGNETFTATVTANGVSKTYTGDLFATGVEHKGKGSEKFAVTLTGETLDLSEADTFTVTIDLPNGTMGAGCFMGLQNIGYNVFATVADIVTSTWRGTDEYHAWSNSQAWDTAPGQLANVVFGDTAQNKTVDVDTTATADSIAVNASGYEFQLNNNLTTRTLDIAADASLSLTGSGIMEINGAAAIAAGGSLSVGAGATLRVTVADAAKSILAAAGVTNNGIFLITDNLTIGENLTSKMGGTLKVADGKRLTLGTTKDSHTINLSSLDALVLGAGANIDTKALVVEINNLTANNSELKMLDTKDKNTDGVVLHGTTTLAGNLTITGDWKYKINIEELAGNGNLQLTGGNEEHRAVIGDVNIGSLDITNKMTNVELNGSVTLSGILTVNGTTNATDSGTLSVGGLNGSAALNVTGGLTFTGTDTYSYTGALNVGGQIVMNGTGSQTISGTALNDTVKVQSGTLVLNGSYAIDNITGDLDIKYTGGDNTGNGFKTSSGTIVVYFVADGAMLTKDSAQFTYGGETVVVDEDGKFQASGQMDYSTLYVNGNGTTESLAHAVAKAGDQLTAVILKDGTTLAADATASLTSLTVVEGASATVELSKDFTPGTVSLASGAALTLGGSGTVTATGLSMAANSTLDITGDIDMGTMALTSAETPAVQVLSGGILTISTASKVDNQGFVNGESGELAGTQAFTKTFKGLAVGVQDGGKLVLKGNVNAVEQGTSGGTYNMGVSNLEIQGNLQLNTWNATTYAVGDNSMKVTGDAWFTNKQDVSLNGGSFEVGGALKLGHNDNPVGGGYRSIVTASNGSTVTLHDIQFYGGHNELNVNGSTLTFTQGSGNVLSQVKTSPTAEADLNHIILTGATLVAENNNWELTATDTATVALTGDTTLDVASGKTMTLGMTSAAGSIIKKGAGTAVFAGAGTSSATIALNEGTLKATASNALGTGAVTMAADTTLELSVGDALGSGQVVTNSGNVLIHKTLTSGTINGGTLTLASDFPVDGGGIEDVGGASTGNGFTQGGVMHVYTPATAALGGDIKVMKGDTDYTVSMDDNGDITLGGADWSIYQLNVENASQPAVQAIMDYADEKGGGTGVLKTIVVNDDMLTLVNDSTTLKTSMLEGEHLDSFVLYMDDASSLTIDGDCDVSIGTTASADGTIVLASDATIGTLSAYDGKDPYDMHEGHITIAGSGYTLKTDGLAIASDGILTIGEGVTVELLPATNFSTMLNATVELKTGASLVLQEVSFATIDDSDASIVVTSEQWAPKYTPSNEEISITGARITFNTTSAFNLGHVIDSTSQVVNAGTGSMRDISSNAGYAELNAQGGDIYISAPEGTDARALTVGDLTLAAGRMVAEDTGKTVSITVNGTASFGEGAKVSSALTMANGSTLEGKPASLENHVLVLGTTATDKLNIGDTLWSALEGMTPEGTMNLFTGVSALTLGGSAYSTEVDLTSIFSHGSEIRSGKYSLSYDGSNVIVTRAADNDRYWKGGSDTWDYSHEYWTDEEGGTNYVTFADGYNAYFTDTTGGTVTLGEDITAASITVSGADYTFAPGDPAHTLTVTDSVEVTGEHTATFDMGLSGTETLKLVAKDKGKLVLNDNSGVKTVEIGAGSTVTANKTLAVGGNVVNNGTLEANGTTSIEGNLSLGDQSTVSGTGTVTAAGVTLQGAAAALTGSLTTGALSGTGTLTLNGGSLTFTEATTLTDTDLAFSGSASITSQSGTLTFKGTLVHGVKGTMTFTGSFDVGNCTTVDGPAVYVEGGSTDNGFKQAQKIVSIISGGSANGTEATLYYKGTAIGKMNDKGEVTFDDGTDYTKFYVNTGLEKTSKALDNTKQELGTFELADSTTLEVDKNISMSMVNVATGKSATMQIDADKTVTTDGTTKALTLTGAGTLAVDAGKTATGVTLANTGWTGTVSFSEAQLETLSGSWKDRSTVSLTGVTGSLGASSIGADVVLNKGTGDWGFGQTVDGEITLNGNLTGNGNLGVKSDTVTSTIILTSNIDGWSGNFVAGAADATLKLTGSDKNINGTVSGSNLTLTLWANATLKSDSSVARVDASSGSLKVDDGKRLTVTDSIIPDNIKLGAGASIVAAFMGGTEYGYQDGTIANGTASDQNVTIDNANITATDTTLWVQGATGVTVSNKLVNATLSVAAPLQASVILNNVQDSLEVAGNLAIGNGGLLKVAQNSGTVKQTLNIGSGTLTTAEGAQMDANLIVNTGVTLNMAGTLNLNGGALTLFQSATLTGDLYTQIEAMEDSGAYVSLFTGVSAFTLNTTPYSVSTPAQLYFSNLADLGDKGDYWLEYNADTDIVSIRFEATSAHTLTWNGTADEHSWVQNDDTVTNWLEGSPAAPAYFQEGDNAKFTADAAVKTVTIAQDITARNITIGSDTRYTFENAENQSITANSFKVGGNTGLFLEGEGKLTLDILEGVAVTDAFLSVAEGSLDIGTDTAPGKITLTRSTLDICSDTELAVATIEGDEESWIYLDGTLTASRGSVSNIVAKEGSTLKIDTVGTTAADTLTVATDTYLYGLENHGTLDLDTNDLTLMEKTEQGGNVTAGRLTLAETGSTFGKLQVNAVQYGMKSADNATLDAENPNLVVESIAPAMLIPSIALDVTETMGDGGSLAAINRLGEEVTYTLIHANDQTLEAAGFTLGDDTLHTLIQNGLLSADGGLVAAGNDLNLTVGGLDLTWYTSKDETEWGYTVVDETGALTDGANTLNGVQHVAVDASRKVDVTGVGSEPGLRVRNLAGLDGRTITFSGEQGDTVNLITTEATASNVNLVAENITVKVGLDALDAMDPVDYKDLRVGNVDLTGATLAVHEHEGLDDAFTVNTLSGDGNSLLKGRVIVEGKGGAYRGAYENANVILHENAEQLLYAGKGLTVAGLGAAKLAYVGPEAHMDAIEGIGMTVTLNDPKQDNSGATLVLDKASYLVDGTIVSGMSAINSAATLDTAGAPNLIQAAKLNLDGTTIILNQDAADDAAMAMAVNDNGKTKGLYLAHLGAEDSNTDRVLLNGYLYNKYYQNARLQGGKLLVDRRDAFFTQDVVRPTTENGRAGAGMLDDALLELNPQVTNPQGDLAAVMTALEKGAVANPDRVASAMAGASAAALGHAFNNDVQRQLRAIRNRTTTMGLAECTTHEGLPYVNAWVNAEGDYRKLDADGTLAGYTLSSWGGTIGCDVDLTNRLTVGAAFTVLHGEFTSHSADMCEGDLDRDYVSLFARYGYRAWTHTFVATLGFAKSKVDRTVNYGTGSYATRGDADGNAFGFLYEVGYTKALNEDASTCLQPIFNVNYRHSSLGGYTEKGGSDAALSVGSADMDAVTFGLGARLQSIVGTSVYNRATLFEGRVLAKLDAGDRDCTTNSSFIGVGRKHSVKSAEVGAFGVEVGAGLTIPVGETGGSIFMDVTGDFRSGYTEFNGTLGYRFSF